VREKGWATACPWAPPAPQRARQWPPLPPEDRAAIARPTYQTISLQCAAPRDYPGDAAMRAVLDEYSWAMAEAASA
jgi:hypothetical protein